MKNQSSENAQRQDVPLNDLNVLQMELRAVVGMVTRLDGTTFRMVNISATNVLTITTEATKMVSRRTNSGRKIGTATVNRRVTLKCLWLNEFCLTG